MWARYINFECELPYFCRSARCRTTVHLPQDAVCNCRSFAPPAVHIFCLNQATIKIYPEIANFLAYFGNADLLFSVTASMKTVSASIAWNTLPPISTLVKLRQRSMSSRYTLDMNGLVLSTLGDSCFHARNSLWATGSNWKKAKMRVKKYSANFCLAIYLDLIICGQLILLQLQISSVSWTSSTPLVSHRWIRGWVFSSVLKVKMRWRPAMLAIEEIHS